MLPPWTVLPDTCQTEVCQLEGSGAHTQLREEGAVECEALGLQVRWKNLLPVS